MLNDLENKTDKTQAKMDSTNDRMKVRAPASGGGGGGGRGRFGVCGVVALCARGRPSVCAG